MGRLLRAEITKLRRPLTLWLTVVAAVACVLFAWQGVKNAAAAAGPAAPVSTPSPSCRDFALPPGPLCDRAVLVQQQIDAYQRQRLAALPSTRHNARPGDASPVEQPLGAAKLALGFMASLPGALVVMLLAAGHVGDEWTDRTIKAVLCQEGRRWRVLAAKLISLWGAALALTLLEWSVLAAASPALAALYPLPGRGLSWSAAWASMAADAARAPLVMALFVLLGVTAAVLVRNALGGFALAAGALVASLALAGNVPAVAPWTAAYWVSGWMQFHSHGFVIYHFWVDGYPSSVGRPGALVGGAGLLGLMVLAAAVAVAVFRRADVTV